MNNFAYNNTLMCLTKIVRIQRNLKQEKAAMLLYAKQSIQPLSSRVIPDGNNYKMRLCIFIITLCLQPTNRFILCNFFGKYWNTPSKTHSGYRIPDTVFHTLHDAELMEISLSDNAIRQYQVVVHKFQAGYAENCCYLNCWASQVRN